MKPHVAGAQGVRKGWVRAIARALPRAAVRERYDALYAQYRAAYPALRPCMQGLRELPACCDRWPPFQTVFQREKGSESLFRACC